MLRLAFQLSPQPVVLDSLACLLMPGFLFLPFYMLGWQVGHRTHLVCTDLGILGPTSSSQAFMASTSPVESSPHSLNNFILNNGSNL